MMPALQKAHVAVFLSGYKALFKLVLAVGVTRAANSTGC
jgi:hypothetical protein